MDGWAERPAITVAFLVVTLIALNIYLVYLFSLCRQCGLKPAALGQAVRHTLARIRHPDNEPRRQMICDHVARERVKVIRVFALVGVHVVSLCLVVHNILLIAGLALPLQRHPDHFRWMSPLSLLVVNYFVLLLGIFRLDKIRPWVVDTWYFLNVVLVLAASLISGQMEFFTIFGAYQYIPRLLFALLVCNVKLTSLCNIVIMFTNFVAQAPDELQSEVFQTILIISALFGFEKWVWTSARYTVQVKASSQVDVTVRKILSACCDAVVTLSSDLRIVGGSPKLANLLLLQSGYERALEGSLFMDFMTDTDRERFRHFVARPPDWVESQFDPSPAQALNVHLRDSSGTSVQVQLFHSHFMDLNDQVGHLIGICEVGDTAAPPAAGSRIAGAGGNTVRTHEGGVSFSCGSEDSFTDIEDELSSELGYSASVIGGGSEVRSQVSQLSVPRDGRSVVGREGRSDARTLETLAEMGSVATSRYPSRDLSRDVTIKFDTLRFSVRQRASNIPVVSASLMERESLQQWIAEWGSFKVWMQDFVNAVLMPVSNSSWPASAGAPSMASFHVSFRGSYSLPSDYLRSRGGSLGSTLPAPVMNVDKVRIAQPRHLSSRRGASSSIGRNGEAPPPHRNRSRRDLMSPQTIGNVISGTLSNPGAKDGSVFSSSDGQRRSNDEYASGKEGVLAGQKSRRRIGL